MSTQPTNTNVTGTQRTRAFISYNRKDKSYLEEFQKQLQQFKYIGPIDYWDDTQIRAGDEWRVILNNALSTARIGVLLISADFLASTFIMEKELPPLLEAAKKGEAKLISIILRPCAYKHYKMLSEIQALNEPSHPLSEMNKSQRERIWLKAAEEIISRLADN